MKKLIALMMMALAPARALAADAGPGYPHPELLVETAWLDENIIRPEIVIVDLRPREIFNQGHIPGSYPLEEARLIHREGTVPSIIPPQEFKALMESLGVGQGVHVIAVDDIGGPAAARLWWALGYYGFDNVSLLNGGYTKWEAEGRAMTFDQAYPRQTVFTPAARPDRAVAADAVRDWKKSHPAGIVVDARSPDEYAGTSNRGKRPGHVPGAVNIPWDHTFTILNDVRVLKTAGDLLALMAKAGVTASSQPVVYCMDGRRTSHLLFTMALLGIEGRNFVGSWAEWSARTDLPVEPAQTGVKPAQGSGAGAKPAKPGSPPHKP